MTRKQMQRLERILLSERERVLKALAVFDDQVRSSPADAGDLTRYPFHPADDGTATMEQEKEYLLASKEGRLLYAIDDALRTLYREPDRYGRCGICGERIVLDRLEIVPWTRFCVRCQEAEEQRGLAA